MKHARDDYQRIQDPAGLIPEDEPVFLLRAQDKFAAATLRFYAFITRISSPEISEMVLRHADLMDQWPKKKDPDL